MGILPRTMGTRPRLACEVRAEGVVAARAEDASAVLTAVSRVAPAEGFAVPDLHMGDEATPQAQGAWSAPGSRAKLIAALKSALESVSLRGRDITLIVPDSAARVLLLDFDELPPKAADALPVVRFRLKKLLPFDADDAAVSYQIMSSARGLLRVLAVAMPHRVLAEYESVVRESGFEPGAVLPSTVAALAGLDEGDLPRLVVNAGREGVTTAIVKGGVLLLHRTVDLGANAPVSASTAELKEAPPREAVADTSISAIAARLAAGTPAPVVEPAPAPDPEARSSEVAQAVSVAAAYFEDTLETSPAVVLSAGPLGAEALMRILDQSYAGAGTVAVQEIVERQMLGDGATSAGQPAAVPLGWLAGVRGALAN